MKKILSVKNLLFLVCFIILLMIAIVTFFIFQNKGNLKSDEVKKYSIEPSLTNLGNYLKSNISNSDSIDISYIESNIVYGGILDTEKNGDLFQTKSLFYYDLRNDVFNKIKFSENQRIWNYYIFAENIYVVLLSKDKLNDYYNWVIRKYDMQLDKYSEIEKASIKNLMHGPKFIYSNSLSKLFVATIEDDLSVDEDKQIQTYKFSEINSDGSLSVIATEKGNELQKKGKFLCSMFDPYIEDSELLFCEVEDYSTQKIISLNLKTNDKKLLYTNKLDEWSIASDFRKIDNKLVVVSYSLENNFQNKITLINLDSLEKETLEENLLYFGNRVLNKNMLFHSTEKWYIYDLSDNKINEVSFPNKYAYPKYFLIDDNNIFFESDNYEFYIGKIVVETIKK